jgi:hypothetical protein
MSSKDYLTEHEYYLVKRAWEIYGIGPAQTKILDEWFDFKYERTISDQDTHA